MALMNVWSGRKRRTARVAQQAGVDALLITHLPDVRWLCGFTGSNAALVLLGNRARLFTDGRYTTQVKAEAVGTPIEISPKAAAIAAAEWIATSAAARCGFDPTHTTVAALEVMRKAVPAKRRRIFQPVAPIVAPLREIKDPAEIAVMREA